MSQRSDAGPVGRQSSRRSSDSVRNTDIVSRHSSQSPIRRKSSDSLTHVSVESSEWPRGDPCKDQRPGTAAWLKIPPVQKVSVTVDHTGTLRAEEKLTVTCQRDLTPAKIAALTPKGQETSPFLRLRLKRSDEIPSNEKRVSEYMFEKATGRTYLEETNTTIYTNRKALSRRLGLRETGDRYRVWSHTHGAWGNELYKAAGTDAQLEQWIHDVSNQVFSAAKGVMRMPCDGLEVDELDFRGTTGGSSVTDRSDSGRLKKRVLFQHYSKKVFGKKTQQTAAEADGKTLDQFPNYRGNGYPRLSTAKNEDQTQVMKVDKRITKYTLDPLLRGYHAKRAADKACVYGQDIRRSNPVAVTSASKNGAVAAKDGFIKRRETIAIHGREKELTYKDLRYYPWNQEG